MDFAVLTGVLRIAKESIFSGLNNLEVCTVLSDKYANAFGFTQGDVRKMAHDLHIDDKLPEIQLWYDGYRFGQYDIYNPWSVVNYAANHYKPMPYWMNTSSNTILREMLPHADNLRIKKLRGLLEDKPVTTTITEDIVYEGMWNSDSTLFTLLMTTGYLTAAVPSAHTYNRYALQIPNKEIKEVYASEILSSLAKGLEADT